MKSVDAVIIGAGQSGLATSHALARHGVDHVILERGQVANSWRTERWESLRLLSPNWMNGLPGLPYGGDDPNGFMTVSELIGNLDACAAQIQAPVRTETSVLSVTRSNGRLVVQTDQGAIECRSAVAAAGACAVPELPACATGLPHDIKSLTPSSYKRQSDLPPGGVLVVGASASGLQLAREAALAGHPVALAVGSHLRLPRDYRGADILHWMSAIGVMDIPFNEVDDIERVRRTPSLPLMGSVERAVLNLNALQDLGVEIVGRLAAIQDGRAVFSGALANLCASADLKMNRLLANIDEWVSTAGLDPVTPPPERFAPTRLPAAPRLAISLSQEGFRSVIWATGYRPDHSWLHLPVFDRKGRLIHDGGVVGDGLYALGLPYLRTRHSTHIAGATPDADALARHLTDRLTKARAA